LDWATFWPFFSKLIWSPCLEKKRKSGICNLRSESKRLNGKTFWRWWLCNGSRPSDLGPRTWQCNKVIIKHYVTARCSCCRFVTTKFENLIWKLCHTRWQWSRHFLIHFVSQYFPY
jgi:hypothetical protein